MSTNEEASKEASNEPSNKTEKEGPKSDRTNSETPKKVRKRFVPLEIAKRDDSLCRPSVRDSVEPLERDSSVCEKPSETLKEPPSESPSEPSEKDSSSTKEDSLSEPLKGDSHDEPSKRDSSSANEDSLSKSLKGESLGKANGTLGDPCTPPREMVSKNKGGAPPGTDFSKLLREGEILFSHLDTDDGFFFFLNLFVDIHLFTWVCRFRGVVKRSFVRLCVRRSPLY